MMNLPESEAVGAVANRRKALMIFGSASLAAVVAGCSSDDSTSGAASTTTAASTTAASSTAASSTTADGSGSSTECSVIPEETAGPYPGDGSNGVNALSEDGIVRRDIRSSFGSSTTTAEGVPLTIKLTIVDTSKDCAPMVGAAVYLWHADNQGRYSMYSNGVTNENYLRGVQVTDASGQVTFESIFPGCYDGRWPHAHFEVYPDVASISSASNKVATSQLAFPEATCSKVYADSLYPDSASNLSRVSLSTDMVFSDGATQETPSVTGSNDAGYVAFLTVPV